MECDICRTPFARIWRDHKTYDGRIYCRSCSGSLRSGEKAYNWNPNLTTEERIRGRDTKEYHDFIKRVTARDNYSCKLCGSKKDIVVHHLNGYNWCVAERTDDNNGVTLCGECHNKYHSIYGKGGNTKEEFEEWIGSSIGTLGEGAFPSARKVICMDDGSIIESAPAAAVQYQIDRNSLYPVLNKQIRSIYNNHFLWYDDYDKMGKDEVNSYWRWVIGKIKDF